jgi:hypothetical protein
LVTHCSKYRVLHIKYIRLSQKGGYSVKKMAKAKWYEDEMNKYNDMMETGAGEMCGKVPQEVVFAHSYVPWQCYTTAFSPSEALMKGTLFPELWGVYPIPK